MIFTNAVAIRRVIHYTIGAQKESGDAKCENDIQESERKQKLANTLYNHQNIH